MALMDARTMILSKPNRLSVRATPRRRPNTCLHQHQANSIVSPSIRFPLQVVIYGEGLPEDMQFHPTTEAIVYKYSLPDPTSPVVVAPSLRRKSKVFMLPKNVMVAEVTELAWRS